MQELGFKDPPKQLGSPVGDGADPAIPTLEADEAGKAERWRRGTHSRAMEFVTMQQPPITDYFHRIKKPAATESAVG